MMVEVHADLTAPMDEGLVYSSLRRIKNESQEAASIAIGDSVLIWDYDDDLQVQGFVDGLDEQRDIIRFSVNEGTFQVSSVRTEAHV